MVLPIMLRCCRCATWRRCKRRAATCMLISKLADPRVYLCDLANLGQLIDFLSAAEVQHCVLLSVPKHLLQFRNVILTLILLA